MRLMEFGGGGGKRSKRKGQRWGEEERGGKGRKERRLFNIRYDSEKDKVSSTREIGEFIKLERERDREEEELIGDCDEQGYGEVVVVQSVNFMVGHFLLFKLMVMMGCVPVLFWGKTKKYVLVFLCMERIIYNIKEGT